MFSHLHGFKTEAVVLWFCRLANNPVCRESGSLRIVTAKKQHQIPHFIQHHPIIVLLHLAVLMIRLPAQIVYVHFPILDFLYRELLVSQTSVTQVTIGSLSSLWWILSETKAFQWIQLLLVTPWEILLLITLNWLSKSSLRKAIVSIQLEFYPLLFCLATKFISPQSSSPHTSSRVLIMITQEVRWTTNTERFVSPILQCPFSL